MEPCRGKADETGSVDKPGMLQPWFEHRTSSKTIESSSHGEDGIGACRSRMVTFLSRLSFHEISDFTVYTWMEIEFSYFGKIRDDFYEVKINYREYGSVGNAKP